MAGCINEQEQKTMVTGIVYYYKKLASRRTKEHAGISNNGAGGGHSQVPGVFLRDHFIPVGTENGLLLQRHILYYLHVFLINIHIGIGTAIIGYKTTYNGME